VDEENPTPTTARDALMIELLGDVGRLHDDIKAIPKILELSMSDSIRIVADAVEDAEKTALTLQESTKDVIRATTTKASFDVNADLSIAILQALRQTLDPALNRATMKIQEIEERVLKVSGSVRDPHATRFNYVLLAGFIITASIMIGGMTWMAFASQDANETNKWFYNEYKAQRGIIDGLPPDMKKRFAK
jgi:hypothetical protein